MDTGSGFPIASMTTMAALMGGATIHSVGEVPIGEQQASAKQKEDVVETGRQRQKKQVYVFMYMYLHICGIYAYIYIYVCTYIHSWPFLNMVADGITADGQYKYEKTEFA